MKISGIIFKPDFQILAYVMVKNVCKTCLILKPRNVIPGIQYNHKILHKWFYPENYKKDS